MRAVQRYEETQEQLIEAALELLVAARRAEAGDE
jgi:hypothetical protein